MNARCADGGVFRHLEAMQVCVLCGQLGITVDVCLLLVVGLMSFCGYQLLWMSGVYAKHLLFYYFSLSLLIYLF